MTTTGEAKQPSPCPLLCLSLYPCILVSLYPCILVSLYSRKYLLKDKAIHSITRTHVLTREHIRNQYYIYYIYYTNTVPIPFIPIYLSAPARRTGSAAIHGLRGKKNVNCFITYPTGKVTEIQQRQMTSIPDKNVHCLSVDGDFDDCQALVKGTYVSSLRLYYLVIN